MRVFLAAWGTHNSFNLNKDNAWETYVYLVAVLALHRNLALGSIGDDRHSGSSSEGHILPHNATYVKHSAVIFQIKKKFKVYNQSAKAMFTQSTTLRRQLVVVCLL